MKTTMTSNEASLRELLLKVLTRHPGKGRAIGMGELYEEVFGKPYSSKINGTRQLRRMITDLRREGVPICSVSEKGGGGYYLASAVSDLEDYLRRLRNQGLKKLALEARLRKQTLPFLLNEIQLKLRTEAEVKE